MKILLYIFAFQQCLDNYPDAKLSLKWICANGSELQSQMPQARTDRQPTHLHPPASHSLSVAQNDLPR